MAAIVATILLAPFFLSFELLVRRGSLAGSALLGLGGRAIIVLLIAAGVWLGALPIVMGLMLGLFGALFVAFEIFATSTYAVSGNVTYAVSGNVMFIALVEAGWLAWIMAAFMPITFVF